MKKWLGILLVFSAPALAQSDLSCDVAIPILTQNAKDALALCVRNSPQEIQRSAISQDAFDAATSAQVLQHSARNQLVAANRPNISRSEAATLESESHRIDSERHQTLYSACVRLRQKIDALYQHAKVKCAKELAPSAAQFGSYENVLQYLSRSVQDSRRAIETAKAAQERTRQVAGATAAAP